MEGAWIYILKCSDGSYYAEVTRRSVDECVREHQNGTFVSGYTFTRRPVELAFSELYESLEDAMAAERRIKGWSRAKKEAYMRGELPSMQSPPRRGRRPGANAASLKA